MITAHRLNKDLNRDYPLDFKRLNEWIKSQTKTKKQTIEILEDNTPEKYNQQVVYEQLEID